MAENNETFKDILDSITSKLTGDMPSSTSSSRSFFPEPTGISDITLLRRKCIPKLPPCII